MHDLIIRNARIVDGTGAAAFMGEVAVADGKIVTVARAGEAPITGEARRSIDAGGHL